MTPFRLAPPLLALVLAACASSTPAKVDAGDTDGMQQTYCKPGTTQTCYCLGAGQGTQVCRADGKSFGSCGGCSGDGGTFSISDMMAGNPCGDCDGCCNGATCVSYQNQSNSQCGVAGTACGTCGSGHVCDGASGLCVVGTNGCTGCDNGCCGTASGGAMTCFVGNAAQCGVGGGVCQQCTHGTLCSSGTCNNMIDPMTQFRVTVSSAQFYNTGSDGSCWDDYAGFGCAQPDVHVCFAYDPGTGYVIGCTTTINNVPPDNGETDSDPNTTDTASWNDTDGLIKDTSGQVFYIPGYAFTQGKVTVYAEDVDDSSSNDLIGSGPIASQTAYQPAYTISNFERVVSINFTLR